jgi:peptidoglycan hydrolase-like protein with peptidoglycan-binding domain
VALQKLLGIKPEDGDFGPATKAAVMKKQGEIGAAVDGIWGPESKAKMSAQAGKVNGQNVSPEHQTAPAPTPPAAISQADKIAKFKALLAKARERAAPNPTDAGNGRSPETQGGPVNPDTAPVTGVPESISYFLNKMRLLEDLTPDEKKQLDDLYKELGDTEQPDPELSSLLNQYNGLFPTGSTASSGADQAGASADAADADAGAAMQSGANRAAREKEYGDNADADDAAQGAAMRDASQAATIDADDAAQGAAMQDALQADTIDAADADMGNTMQSQSMQNEFGNATEVTKPEEIPMQADKKVPYWIKGKRYVYKTIRGTASWFPEDIGYFAGAGPKETADKLIKQQYTGSQANAPTSESIQRNSENQRLRELAGIAEAVAPVTKNAPDYPTNQVKADTRMMTQNLSGGLNGAKSSGQTTTPVVASQVKRLHSHVSEGQRMIDLYKTISAIENKEG